MIQDFAVSLSVILSSLILGLGCDQSFCSLFVARMGRGSREGEWKVGEAGKRGSVEESVAHVRPVDRFTPARKAERRTASKA